MKFQPLTGCPLDIVGLRRYAEGPKRDSSGLRVRSHSKEFSAIYAWADNRSSSFLAEALAEAYEHIELLEARLARAEEEIAEIPTEPDEFDK